MCTVNRKVTKCTVKCDECMCRMKLTIRDAMWRIRHIDVTKYLPNMWRISSHLNRLIVQILTDCSTTIKIDTIAQIISIINIPYQLKFPETEGIKIVSILRSQLMKSRNTMMCWEVYSIKIWKCRKTQMQITRKKSNYSQRSRQTMI